MTLSGYARWSGWHRQAALRITERSGYTRWPGHVATGERRTHVGSLAGEPPLSAAHLILRERHRDSFATWECAAVVTVKLKSCRGAGILLAILIMLFRRPVRAMA